MKTYIIDIKGTKYSISVEEILYSQAQILLHTISTIPTENIKNGYKIEIGFSVYILVENDDGYRIVVPDYTKSPFTETTEDLTIALWIQKEQTGLLRLYNVFGESVRFDDKIVVSKGVLQKSQISLQRFCDLGESGWCVNEIVKDENGQFLNETTNDYESYYIYQLLNMRPALIKVLTFPYDYIVVFEDDEIIEILNENDESLVSINK